MPVYQYKCKNCEFSFEKYMKVENRDQTICPKCNSNDVARNFSTPTVIFNGDGFYITDNKKEK